MLKMGSQGVGLRRYVIRYSSGNFAKSLHESTFSFLYLFFLVEVLGLDPAIAGTALLVAMLLDAGFNLIFGHVIDRWIRRLCSYQAMILIAAPFSAVFFILLFAVPAWASKAEGLEVFVATILFRAGCTLVDLPHNALLADLTSDGRDRIGLSAWRFFFSSFGNLAVLFGLAPVLAASELSTPTDFVLPAIAISCVYVMVMIYCATGAATERSGEAAPADARGGSALLNIVRNGRLVRILAVCVLSAGLVTVFMRGTVFYAKAWLGDAYLSTYLVGAQLGGQILGLPLWRHIASRTEKTTAAIAAQLLVAASMAAFFALSPSALAMALPLFFTAGLGVGGLTVMNWAIVPDTIEYTEAACGRRHEGLTFGTLLFLNKVASGFAAALVGWLLGAIDYDGDRSGALIAIITVVPFLGAIGSAIVLGSLQLTHREHQILARGVGRGD